jgi:hypothetical protein
MSPQYQNFVPEPLRHRGVLWWRSQLARYVFRPLPFVLEYISHRRAAIGWPSATHHHHHHHPHNDQQEIAQEQEERVSEATATASATRASASATDATESRVTGSSERVAGGVERRGGARQQQGQAVVGVHVRHGDKSWDVVHQGSYIGALPPYIAKAQRLYARARACGGAANPTAAGHAEADEDAGHAEADEDAANSSARQFACKPRYFISTDDASVLDEARDMGLDVFWDAEEAR